MKYLTFLLITLSSCGYGQYPKLKGDSFQWHNNRSIHDSVYKKYKDAIDSGHGEGLVLYGTAGIYQPIDSSKIYYRKALELRKRGVPDSVNRYKKLLENYKKK